MIRLSRTLTTSVMHMQKLLISDAAATRLAQICTDTEYLRISVGGGGCSGYSYEFELSSEAIDTEQDLVFTHENKQRVVTDRESIDFMDGSTIDFKMELIKKAFVVADNPKAADGCSCGASFSIELMRCGIGLLVAVVISQSIDEQINVHFAQSGHTNNWAVLVCASRYWYNYRHIANTLSVYRSVKRLGIPDSQIVLFLADDMACNGRNGEPGAVYNHRNKLLDLYGNDVEVDFRGEEVTVQNVIRLLTGRQDKDTPRSRRLNTDSKSNVLFYLTGHGGEDFLKFQDDEEISAYELADAFEQMHQKQRYNEFLFIIDTCQAESMIRNAYSPGFVGFASSKVGEDSLSHHVDMGLGVYMVDRFTFHLLEFLETISPNSKKALADIKKVCPTSQCISTPVNKFNLLSSDRQRNAKVIDFFGSERKILYNKETVDAQCPLLEIESSVSVASETPTLLSFEQSMAIIEVIEHTRNGKHEKMDKSLFYNLISLLTVGSVIYSACLL